MDEMNEQQRRVLAIVDELVLATDEQIYRRYKRLYGDEHSAQGVRSRRAELTNPANGEPKVRFSGRYSRSAKGRRAQLWEVVK